MLAAALAATGVAGFGLFWMTAQSDAISVDRQVRVTRRALDDMVARLAQEQETVAIWDDPVAKLGSGNPDWAWFDENIGTWLNDIYGHDQVFILDANDRPLYASSEGRRLRPELFEPSRADIQHMIDVVRGRRSEPSHRFDRLAGRAPGQDVLTTPNAIHNTHLVNLRGVPAAVSVMRMGMLSAPSPRPTSSAPIMVNVRFLGQSFPAELARRNLIEAPRFSATGTREAGEEVIALGDETGRTVTYFHWRPELPGTRILKVLGPGQGAILAALLLILVILMLRLRRSTSELEGAMLQLRASEAQAQHLAFHDGLTGLPNRALFNDRVDHELVRVRRGGRLALLLLDLDRFKHVNDTLGHMAGDALIREFACRVVSLVREGDTLARLGGDEFALLLPGMGSAEEVQALCERILQAVHQPFQVLGNSAFVGVSIGVVIAPDVASDRVELMRKADVALYRAKDEGRNCARAFSETMDERVRFRGYIEEELRRALNDQGELFVQYQPEMAADGTTIVGLEALARWEHPRHGLVPPEQFVPVAEETGLIAQLGEWVLGEACRVARRWPDLFIAVNLSPVQFRAAGFSQRVLEIIREAGVDPRQIELEVTEGVLLDDDDLIRSALADLRKAGIRIALDDFGTGYSSFSYLRRFEVDKIKIDRSFVQHLGHQVDSASLVSAVVTIGHAMGLTITAEGVETGEQKRFLSAIGCNQMQGYLFARPMSLADIDALLASADNRADAA